MKCRNLFLDFTSLTKLALIARIFPTRYPLKLGLNFASMANTSATSMTVSCPPASSNTVDRDTMSESDLTPLSSGDDQPKLKGIKRKRIVSPELSQQLRPTRKFNASTPIQDASDAFIDEKVADKRRIIDATTERKLAVDSEGERSVATTTPSPKKRKPRAPKPEPVYVIPDVERLETQFKGRLGKSASIGLLCLHADSATRLCLHEHCPAQQEASQ